MDLLLKDVPEEAVEAVKEMTAVVVERHYRKTVVAPEAVQDAFEVAVDTFREKNGLEKKFAVEPEPKE